MANPGDLDTSFDGNGKKAINFGGTDAARVVLVQPNGRIVVAGGGAGAGSFCGARLRTNGALDTTFGSGGKRVIDFGGDDESVYGAALQPDGKIVLAGASDLRVAVARLNLQRLARHHVLRRRQRRSSAGARSAAPRPCSCCRTARSCSSASRARGREHPGRAPERERRAGHDVRHRRQGPGRLRDHDLGVRKLAIQHRVGPLLVGSDDQVVPAPLDELAQPELARHAAQQLPGVKSMSSGDGVFWPP
jgi:uncharacterized delta-60 repeat protein